MAGTLEALGDFLSEWQRIQLEILGRKIIRGITYKLDHRFIEDDKEEIEIYFLKEEDDAKILERIRRNGQTFAKGPGIQVIRWIANDGIMFYIEIWGKLTFYASLLPKE